MGPDHDWAGRPAGALDAAEVILDAEVPPGTPRSGVKLCPVCDRSASDLSTPAAWPRLSAAAERRG